MSGAGIRQGGGKGRKALALGLILAAAAYGVAAVGSGLDRVGRGDLALAQWVPEAFANRSLGDVWQAAVTRGDRGAVEEIARRAVDRAPVESSSMAMYGAAQGYLGRAGQSDEAFRLAARLGWRVPATQMYWLRQGLIEGDYANAAAHFDALMRLEVPFAGRDQILAIFETNPLAAAALVDRLAVRPKWLGDYVGEVGDLSGEALDRRVGMIDLLSQAGNHIACSDAGGMASHLVERGNVAEARQVWAIACGGTPDSLVSDGHLARLRLDDPGSPFLWSYSPSGDVTADLTPDAAARGQWLEAHNTTSVGIPLLQQRLIVEAGRYRVTWSSPGDASGPMFFPATGCVVSETAPLRAIERRGDSLWSAPFEVHSGCSGIWLQFWLAGSGQGRLGRIDVTGGPDPASGSTRN